MERVGHCRLGRLMAGKARYLVAGLDNTAKTPEGHDTNFYDWYRSPAGPAANCVICLYFRIIGNSCRKYQNTAIQLTLKLLKGNQ